MVHYSVTTVPTGWLECNGAAVSRTTYSRLFAAIGTTYGAGDGSTTFNLPNANRRTLVGRGGTGNAILSNTLGSTGGSDTHTLIEAELASHSHQIGFGVTGGGGSLTANSVLVGATATVAAGGNLPHNNIQQSLVLVTLIKT